MVKKKVDPEGEMYYIGIKEPMEVRRELLMSSRGIIQTLKRYETFKTLREEKLNSVYELKRVMEEIAVLNRKLKRRLPASKIRMMELLQDKKAEQKETPQIRVQERVKEEKTRLELLESELDKIENRLNELG
ncbi:hypothetical protein J4410_03420 [Candidatus Woesearchaeota archaeon]|nr:hypothetical protein [Candidatus Woesearchaeota archaeon]